MCSRKKYHKNFTGKIEISLGNHGVFETKNDNSRKTKNPEWETQCFSNKIFTTKNNFLGQLEHQAPALKGTQIPQNQPQIVTKL